MGGSDRGGGGGGSFLWGVTSVRYVLPGEGLAPAERPSRPVTRRSPSQTFPIGQHGLGLIHVKQSRGRTGRDGAVAAAPRYFDMPSPPAAAPPPSRPPPPPQHVASAEPPTKWTNAGCGSPEESKLWRRRPVTAERRETPDTASLGQPYITSRDGRLQLHLASPWCSAVRASNQTYQHTS